MSPQEENDDVERDFATAVELMEIQPAHTKIAELLARVLAVMPQRSSALILLAQHHQARDDLDEAHRLLQRAAGYRDAHFVSAAAELRDLERLMRNYDEALEWAVTVLQERQDQWNDHMALGAIIALAGDLEPGWRTMDDAVALCARTSPDELANALTQRTVVLLQTFAPLERLTPAAEETIRVDPANETIGPVLGWTYIAQGRFAEAEEAARQMLRQDPTSSIPQITLDTIRGIQGAVDKHPTVTLEDFGTAGVMTKIWNEQRARLLGLDLASALAALDEIMPRELAHALHDGASEDEVDDTDVDPAIICWHDGQEPGTASAWGQGFRFRLMSMKEIQEMDEAIEADPAAHPQWKEEELNDYYSQFMTDDDGGYLAETLTGVVLRRPGFDDERVADSLADWFWDRVVDFGGQDPRPRRKPASDTAPTTAS